MLILSSGNDSCRIYINGWCLPRRFVTVDALRLRIIGWKSISKSLGRSALTRRSIFLIFSQRQYTEQRENTWPAWTPRSLTNFITGMGVPNPSGKKDKPRGTFRPAVLSALSISEAVPCGNRRALKANYLCLASPFVNAEQPHASH